MSKSDQQQKKRKSSQVCDTKLSYVNQIDCIFFILESERSFCCHPQWKADQCHGKGIVSLYQCLHLRHSQYVFSWPNWLNESTRKLSWPASWLRWARMDYALELELTIPMQVVTQFKIADTKKFDKTINTEDQLAALGWEYLYCQLIVKLCEMAGRWRGGGWCTTPSSGAGRGESTWSWPPSWWTSSGNQMIDNILMQRGLLAPHEIDEMMLKAHDMKVVLTS